MKHKILKLLLLSSVMLCAEMQSAYTKIDAKHCKTIRSKDAGYSTGAKCEKYKHIGVEKVYLDGREDIVLLQHKKRFNLQFMQKVWSGFSEFGSTLEWRFPKGKAHEPVAMISRYICGGYDKNGNNTSTHRLVVTKISQNKSCVVGWINPGKNQNLIARKMADKAQAMPCLKNK